MKKFVYIITPVLLSAFFLSNVILPVEKGTGDEKEKELKAERNRITPPAEDKIERSISVEGMLNSKDSATAFNAGSAAIIEGYVFGIAGQKEDCGSPNEKDCDLIIYLAKDQKATQNSDCIIVGITRATRAIEPAVNWQYLKSIMGKHVVITGWMLYDFPHVVSSYETHPYGFKLDRHTVWEIYPATALRVDE